MGLVAAKKKKPVTISTFVSILVIVEMGLVEYKAPIRWLCEEVSILVIVEMGLVVDNNMNITFDYNGVSILVIVEMGLVVK